MFHRQFSEDGHSGASASRTRRRIHLKRLHLIEIEDQFWCPRAVRDGVTDYLQFAQVATRTYAPIASLLADALRRTESRRVVDLCSGGAGPWLWLLPVLHRAGLYPTVELTDLQPNLEAFEHARRESGGAIMGRREPVNATSVPEGLPGFRTLFTSFHHFRPEQARSILADAVHRRQGIGIFEATQRHPKTMLAMVLAPLAVWLMTPWIRPFRWSRLLWTYLIPAVPVVTLFDGLVSCLRVYNVEELNGLVSSLGTPGYEWRIGTVRGHRVPVLITYLIGIPTRTPG